MGGCLSHLNNFRGVADAVEVLNFDNQAIILEDNGGEINTTNLVPTKKRILKINVEPGTTNIKVKRNGMVLMDKDIYLSSGQFRRIKL